jgi:hypothetical protein
MLKYFAMQEIRKDAGGLLANTIVTFRDALFAFPGPRKGETVVPTIRTDGVNIIPHYKVMVTSGGVVSIRANAKLLSQPSSTHPSISVAVSAAGNVDKTIKELAAAKWIYDDFYRLANEQSALVLIKDREALLERDNFLKAEEELGACIGCKGNMNCSNCPCLANAHWCIPGVCKCNPKYCINRTRWLLGQGEKQYCSYSKCNDRLNPDTYQCRDGTAKNSTDGGGTTSCCGLFFHKQCKPDDKSPLCYPCFEIKSRKRLGFALNALKEKSSISDLDALNYRKVMNEYNRKRDAAQTALNKATEANTKALASANIAASSNVANVVRVYLGSFRSFTSELNIYGGSVTQSDNNRILISADPDEDPTKPVSAFHISTIRGAHLGGLDAHTQKLVSKLYTLGCVFEPFLLGVRKPSTRFLPIDVHVKGPDSVRSNVADNLRPTWSPCPRIYCSPSISIRVPPPRWYEIALVPGEVPIDRSMNRENRPDGLASGSNFYKDFDPGNDPKIRHKAAEIELHRAERELALSCDHLQRLETLKAASKKETSTKAESEALGRAHGSVRESSTRVSTFQEVVKTNGFYEFVAFDPGRRNIFEATRRLRTGLTEIIKYTRSQYRSDCGTQSRKEQSDKDIKHLAVEYKSLATVTAKTSKDDKLNDYFTVKLNVHSAIMDEKRKLRWREREFEAYSRRHQALDKVISGIREGNTADGTARRFGKQIRTAFAFVGAGKFPSQGKGSPGGGTPTTFFLDRLKHIFGSNHVVMVDEHRSTLCCSKCGLVVADVQSDRPSHFHARRDFAKNLKKPPDRQIQPRTWYTINGLKCCQNPLCSMSLMDRDYYPTLSIGDAGCCWLRNEPPPSHMRRGKGVHPEDKPVPPVKMASLDKFDRFIKEHLRTADLLKPPPPPPLDPARLASLSSKDLSSLGRKSPGRTRRAKARKHRLVAASTTTTAAAAAVHNGAPTTTSTTTSNNNIIGSGKASSDEYLFSGSERPQTRGGYFNPIQQGSADSALAAHFVHSIEEKLGETRDDQLSSNMVSLSRVSVVPLLSRNPTDTSREREGLG